MDAKPASSLAPIPLLISLCVAVIAAGVVWPAWDMFGAERRPMLQGWDDSFYYYWMPSVIIDHDVDFANQLAESGTMDPATRDVALSLPRTKTGFVESKYPPGWAIGSLPFFLLVHAFTADGATGFEPPYLVSVWLGQLFYAVIGLALATKILARYFPPNIAVTAMLAGWLTSPLVYYQTARLSMSHSQVFVLAMAVFWITLRIRDDDTNKRSWVLLGFFSALLIVTRNVAFVYLAMPAWIISRRMSSVAEFVSLLLGAAVPVALQLVAWKLLYGSWVAYSYGGERFNFHELHLQEILFSPLHGWFYWHPISLVGALAFLLWAWKRPEGRAWLLSLVAIIGLSAAWPTWWLGSSFGYRGFEVPTLFVMTGIAVLLQAATQRALVLRLLWTTIGIAIVWNLSLLALFLTQRIPREAPVTYRDVGSALSKWLMGM